MTGFIEDFCQEDAKLEEKKRRLAKTANAKEIEIINVFLRILIDIKKNYINVFLRILIDIKKNYKIAQVLFLIICLSSANFNVKLVSTINKYFKEGIL